MALIVPARVTRGKIDTKCLDKYLQIGSMITIFTMTAKEFYRLLDELLENEPGTIRGDEILTNIPKWDSLAIIGFIALLDQHFGMSVPAAEINNCRTINDIVSLVRAKLSD